MPTIFITRTLGPNILEGTIRNLPSQTIRALDKEAGKKAWYQTTDPRARSKDIRRRAAEAAAKSATTVTATA